MAVSRAVSGAVSPIRTLEGFELENTMAEIEKGQQLAGHFPDAEALDRARRVLTGDVSAEDAREEIRRKYNQA